MDKCNTELIPDALDRATLEPTVAAADFDATPILSIPDGVSGSVNGKDALRQDAFEEDNEFGILEEESAPVDGVSTDSDLLGVEADGSSDVMVADKGHDEQHDDPVELAREEVRVALDDPLPEPEAGGAGTDIPNKNLPPTGGDGPSGENPDVSGAGEEADDPDIDAAVASREVVESDTPRLLSVEERRERVENRSILLARGPFVTASTVIESIDHPNSFQSAPSISVSNGVLLARRIEDEDGPNEQAHLSYSSQYLSAVKEYKEDEEIERAGDALQEVATDDWGQLLAWGIRAEYQDEIQSYGEYMTVEEATAATGIPRSTLYQRGLIDRVDTPDGKRTWVVPTVGLMDREHWFHQAFDQLSHEPELVAFYGTREVADMLDQKYTTTIRKMLSLNLLPGVKLEAPIRDDQGGEQRSSYVRIPKPDVDALRDYWEGNQRKTLRAVVRAFREDNPNQFTITRGRFEAYAAAQRQQGGLRTKSSVERLLGTSDKFLEFYDLASGEDAMKALRWNRVDRPDRRVSEVDARTVRAAVHDVLKGRQDPGDVAKRYGVDKRSIYNWLNDASRGRL